MSATVHPSETRRPMPGDQVTARTVISSRDARNSTISERVTTITLPDGSLVLTRDEVALFGNGDADRGRHEIKSMIANERERVVKERSCLRSESPQVVVAKPEDEDGIYELLCLDIQENAASVAPASEECIRETIKQALSRPGVAAIIRDPEGKIIAVLMLMARRWWWSRSFYYQEVPLFVHPNHRKSNYARQLLAFARWWVDAMTEQFGYRVHLMCGVLGTRRVQSKIALYRRLFRQAGAVFVYPSPVEKGG